jgi:hypothetical protein
LRWRGVTPRARDQFGEDIQYRPLPNDVFANVLELPTLWVPHSHPACAQHASDEHLLGSVAREALQLMAGLFWDLGDDGARIAAQRSGAWHGHEIPP